jgi:serine/threonine protein kinase
MVDYDYRVKTISLWCAMGICLACNDPNQSTSLSFCTVCGAKLLLQERYAAVKVLGQGAFGKTFLATDNGKPSRPNCVIKQFVYDDPNSKAKALMLFDEEAVRLDDLGQHPQIPALLAHCQHEGRSYLVQEFIDGDNLQIELDRHGALSEWEVRDVLLQLLPVLDYIHRRQVIHRDIKPENIMRRRSGEQLVLVDFGAAKYASATALAKTGTTIGSPSYAAPEQARGKAVFASDLYGLGVTCLHLLTGVDPFTMFDDLSLGFAWRDFLSGKLVSGELGNILDKLTQHRPVDRYGTAGEVLTGMGATAPKSTITKPAFSGKTATDFFNDGKEKSGKSDFKGEIADYNEAIRLKPDYVRAYSARGRALQSLGQEEKANDDFQKAISLVCKTADDYYGRGNAKSNLGDKYGAIADYNEATRLNPNFADAYFNRGYEKSNLGDKYGAIADYNEAIRINPNFADAYKNRAYEKYINGDKYGAIADYTESIRINPNYADAYFNRGVMKSELEDKYGAIADYTESIRINPNYADAYKNRAYEKYINGDKYGAIADNTELIRINPNFAEAYYDRGVIKSELGDKQEAISDYNEAIRIKPNDAQGYYARGLIKIERNEKQGALADFRKALELYQQQGNTEWYNNSRDRIRELGGE